RNKDTSIVINGIDRIPHILWTPPRTVHLFSNVKQIDPSYSLMTIRGKIQRRIIGMDKRAAFFSRSIDRISQIFRLSPSAVCLQMADIDITSAMPTGPVAHEIQILAVGRQTRLGIPIRTIDRGAYISRLGPSI